MDDSSIHARMYAMLCVAASTAIDLIDAGKALEARSLLEKTLDEAEDFYIEETEIEIFHLPSARKCSPEEKAQLRLWRWERDED